MDAQPTNQDRSKEGILFPNGNRAQLVAPAASTKAADILEALGIQQPRAVIIITGGADGLDEPPIYIFSLVRGRRTEFFKAGFH